MGKEITQGVGTGALIWEGFRQSLFAVNGSQRLGWRPGSGDQRRGNRRAGVSRGYTPALWGQVAPSCGWVEKVTL
jgi:hypothetical protein